MPATLHPGVYVLDVPPVASPIAGVGTSTAAFMGVVANDVIMPVKAGKPEDPTNARPADHLTIVEAKKPFLVTSWQDFKDQFGDFQKGNIRLALAVFGFLTNGGTRCWVMRVAVEADLANLTPLLETFEPIDEVATVAAPGAIEKAQKVAMIDHCTKLGDRVCVLDGVPTAAKGDIDGIKGKDGGGLPTPNSSYAALYFPWIRVQNPIFKEGSADPVEKERVLSLPPSAHVAGIYARVDGTRGVHKAPANEVVLGAVDLDLKLTANDQDGLNPAGINAIRAFNGTIKVYGGRTLGGDANNEFRYLSVRRFINFLKESIDKGTQFVVFEPNNPALWQRITRSVSDFLYNQWRDGALFGETAKQAFFVKCDAETNPPSVREAGQVITEIGVAVTKPAEFVIFRIQQTTGS